MSIYFLFILQQLIASSTHLFAKDVVMTLHPVNVVFYRGAFSVLLYSGWLWFQKSNTNPISRKDWKRYLLLGLVNMPLNQLLFVWGLRYTTPANASLAYALSPAFVALLGLVFYRERLSRQMLIGISIAFAGTFVVLFEKGLATSPEYLLGNAMELCASMSWAFYTVLGRSLSLEYGAIRTTGISMLTGFAMFSIVTLLAPVPFAEPNGLSQHQWFGVAYLGLITSGIGFGLWKYLLTKRSSAQVAVFNNLQPVLTTILTILIFGLRPSLFFVIGGVVTLLGIVITQRK